MGRIRIRTCLALVACVACVLLAAPAQASFHLIQVREVYAGSATDLEEEFIELQMYAPGQVQVQQADVMICNIGACPITVVDLPSPVALGDSQRTVLLASPAAEAAFGVSADFPLPDMNTIAPEAGAVCWGNLDCVEWGNGTPGTPSTAGSPAPQITPGQSLTRSIAPGCPTLLESGDDTNNSAADFSQTTPTPRSNAVAPTEKSCAGGSNGAPNTKIKKRPKNRSTDTSPTFKFKSTEAGSKFKCKLDHKKFKKCHSPKTYHGLDPGKHTFKVEAIDADGNVDPTPAKDKFKVLP